MKETEKEQESGLVPLLVRRRADLTLLIEWYAKRHGLTKIAMLDRIGINRDFIHRTKRHRSIRLDMAVAIADECQYDLVLVPRTLTPKLLDGSFVASYREGVETQLQDETK